MIKAMIFSVLLIWCIQSKANIKTQKGIVNNNRSNFLLAKTDSSNYKIKILKTDSGYCHVNFTIVDEKNTPLNGMISLNGESGKSKSALLTNEDGKIAIMISDVTITHIVVTRIGYGRVIIPIEKVKNKVTEIRVQLFPYATEN